MYINVLRIFVSIEIFAWEMSDTILTYTVFEIKVIFSAPSGCKGSKNVRPAACPCTPLIYSNNKSLKKRAHTGRTSQKNVHPPAEMCAPGAGRTLNFEHCVHYICYINVPNVCHNSDTRQCTALTQYSFCQMSGW